MVLETTIREVTKHETIQRGLAAAEELDALASTTVQKLRHELVQQCTAETPLLSPLPSSAAQVPRLSLALNVTVLRASCGARACGDGASPPPPVWPSPLVSPALPVVLGALEQQSALTADITDSTGSTLVIALVISVLLAATCWLIRRCTRAKNVGRVQLRTSASLRAAPRTKEDPEYQSWIGLDQSSGARASASEDLDRSLSMSVAVAEHAQADTTSANPSALEGSKGAARSGGGSGGGEAFLYHANPTTPPPACAQADAPSSLHDLCISAALVRFPRPLDDEDEEEELVKQLPPSEDAPLSESTVVE